MLSRATIKSICGYERRSGCRLAAVSVDGGEPIDIPARVAHRWRYLSRRCPSLYSSLTLFDAEGECFGEVTPRRPPTDTDDDEDDEHLEREDDNPLSGLALLLPVAEGFLARVPPEHIMTIMSHPVTATLADAIADIAKVARSLSEQEDE